MLSAFADMTTFWDQDRLLVAVVVTAIIVLIIGFFIWGVQAAPRLLLALSRTPPHGQASTTVISVIRGAILTATIITTLLSFWPREDLGLALITLFFIWPFLLVQFIIGCLPWPTYWRKDPHATLIWFGAYGLCALTLLVSVLRFTSWL